MAGHRQEANIDVALLATADLVDRGAHVVVNTTAGDAAKHADFASVENFDASAFSFYSEVKADLQHKFLDEMKIDHGAASEIAQKFSQLAGYPLALAA